MNAGLLRRALRETGAATAGFALALAAVETILSIALPALGGVAGPLLDLPFFRGIVQALIGVEGGSALDLGASLAAIAWVHPVVLALVWGHGIALCTRIPAGELERGTLDVLLGLPVSRWTLWWHDGLVWAVSAAAVSAAAALGSLAGRMGGGAPIPPGRLVLLVVNLFAVASVVGALASLASSLSDRRGRAIGAVFALVLAAFLVNYLGQFWSAAARFAFLTPLHYDAPIRIIRDGAVPASDLAVLFAAALVLWLAGGIVFVRRDLLAA